MTPALTSDSASSLASGTPIWCDLPTSDRAAGKEFYTALFGWGWHEFTTAELGTYSLATLYGRDVAALMDAEHTARPADGPKLWRVFFWTDDLDAAATRCTASGGKLLRNVHQHGDLGRSIECTTNEGVPIVLWSGRDQLAGQPSGDIGTPNWVEYYTRDRAGAYRFFDTVLGAKFKQLELPMASDPDTLFTYHLLSVGEGIGVGGMLDMAGDDSWGDLAPHMMVYFAVDDTDATAQLADQHGGRICVPPMDIPSGRFAVLEDPQGGTFSVMQMDPNWSPPA